MRNKCGIPQSHAYSVIEAFQLRNRFGQVEHHLYMLRNPWSNAYNDMRFNQEDPIWTSHYKSQVPFGVDPSNSYGEGIFFVNHTDFIQCFASV